MGEMQTITVAIPVELLERAQAETGGNIEETVRAGLKRLASGRAQRRLLDMRGTIDFELDLDELRYDRE